MSQPRVSAMQPLLFLPPGGSQQLPPPLLTSPGFVPIQKESGSQGELSPPTLLLCLEAVGFTLLGLIHTGRSRLPRQGTFELPGQDVTLLILQHLPVQRRVRCGIPHAQGELLSHWAAPRDQILCLLWC